ncbi:tetratricopeptide repeat protein [Maribacter sp. IgM3_T14_3]|uniref:tetratricopeptide repeat protein n=1 Tax=Maribacter sp. IgM3_T14_3 TaxID=3415140 RepID=UPI003C6F41B0
MKLKCTLFFLIISLNSFAQNNNYLSWEKKAAIDISLQPEYGNVVKTEEQIESDNKFRKEILEHYKGDTIAASKKMNKLAFTYLYDKGDFVTAMRRFNQANMLNSKNADAYYGFGAIYFNLGALDKAREQYEKGLVINPKHTKILTDYGTTYLGDYYQRLETGASNANQPLITANEFLEKSLKYDGSDSNTIYKLSIIKMYLGDCKKAKGLLKKAKKMNNPNVTEAYENELSEKCNS